MIEALATIALATAVGGSVALLILWIPDSVLAWLIPLSIEQVPDDRVTFGDSMRQWSELMSQQAGTHRMGGPRVDA